MLAELGGTLDPHVEHCPDCSERLRGYRTIAGLIAHGATVRRAPPSWAQRTLARLDAAPRRRRVRVALRSAMLAAAAAAIVLVVLWHHRDRQDSARLGDEPPPATPRLALQLTHAGAWRGEAHPGDQLSARADAAEAAYFEIRVYRGARELLVRCPGAGAPVCRGSDGSLLLWPVPSVGTYQVVLLVSPRPVAAPAGSLDDDMAAATAAGARAAEVETLHVR
jgi:hypothetical protein